MNRSLPKHVVEELVRQLVFLDEERTVLLDKHFPRQGSERTEFEHFLDTYRKKLEWIIQDSRARELRSIVLIGSQVTVLQNGRKIIYKIVLPNFSDMDQGHISFMSTIGRHLLLSKKGSTIAIKTPTGSIKLTISNVEFKM